MNVHHGCRHSEVSPMVNSKFLLMMLLAVLMTGTENVEHKMQLASHSHSKG